jgi:2-succinyl-6-hydroxy-2,4-cyclohexadiene-1-carboxylate synthase
MTSIIVNGLQLNVEIDGHGPPLLLLHGFTGSAGTWREMREAWRGRRTVAVDLIGHGASDAPADERRYEMKRCIADLVALLDALDIGRTSVLGYSMGGRVALHLALAAPERVSALVLESASPGIGEAAERAARVAADRALADEIERDGVAAFIDRWERLPLFASQQRLPEARRAALRTQRLANRAAGLANSLRGMGAGAQAPLWNRLGELAMPALLVAGDEDEKYRDIARRMSRSMPGAEAVIVPDAGHAVHLEQPPAFTRRIKEFLAACQHQTETGVSLPRP